MAASEEKRNKELPNSPPSSVCCDKFLYFHSKFASSKPSSVPPTGNGKSTSDTMQRKHGGWKSMPFVLGNETFERLAALGLLFNFMVFLLTQFHMDQVSASNVINIWFGFSNFAPLLGAFIADSYLGRFKTIAFASFSSLTGMVTMTIIAWMPELHPPECSAQSNQCEGPTRLQLGILVVALVFLSIGTGGIRPCSLPFGVDQFDSNTEEGRKGITSFFNWYYTTFTIVMIMALTLVVYIQASVSWVWGFGILTMFMFCSIILFFVGTRLYVYVKPEGSVFSGMVRVVAAAYKKRKARVPVGEGVYGAYYDPPMNSTVVKKLPLSNKYRFLNKAALVMDGEIRQDGSNANPWILCSIQQVEEFKCLIRIIPIWAAGIMSFTAIVQQATFTISQASKMNRHLTPSFQIPAGSLGAISMITVATWIPIYDRILVPSLRKITKIEGGITLLQRIGIGLCFSVMSMIVAGLVERMRKDSALKQGRPISVFWLAPQLALMGFAEAFNIIGQIEFYNREFPENMSSVANSLFSCTMAGASYVSSIIVNVVHKSTGRNGRPDWLTKDINRGNVDDFYYLIAGMGALNFGYFVWVSRKYDYKSRMRIDDHDDSDEKSRFESKIGGV